MPDAMIPQVGDIINTNYSVPESPGLRVTRVIGRLPGAVL
jgi:hypothetical protein